MKKAIILIAFLILVSSFLSLPSATHARDLYEVQDPVTSPTNDRNNPSVKCAPGSPYRACINTPPTPKPQCHEYSRNCKK
ncbi:hypothetical protein QN277_001129 [Acacia crassicarpa]|uniref:Uncharacterized protein n=1 Tax=Acacia crassicarpa TaxID=499986 RepID=A0AAE1N6T2_9FABA|nr:hypothetical protein QN277_001129 [Acacia crassicarpa]